MSSWVRGARETFKSSTTVRRTLYLHLGAGNVGQGLYAPAPHPGLTGTAPTQTNKLARHA